MRAPSASLGQYCRSRGSDIRFKAADGKSASAASEAATRRRSGWHYIQMTRDRCRRRLLPALSAWRCWPAPGAAGQSLAGWREDMKTFRIGMIAEPGAGSDSDWPAPLKQAYAQALGIPVEIFVARDYAALIDAQATHASTTRSIRRRPTPRRSLLCGCVEPVAAPVSDDGATGIKAILVTRDGRLPKPPISARIGSPSPHSTVLRASRCRGWTWPPGRSH